MTKKVVEQQNNFLKQKSIDNSWNFAAAFFEKQGRPAELKKLEKYIKR